MAGMRELGFPRTDGLSLRELAARTTLRNVRSKGHTYVDLREDGKRFVFFCTLCLAPCYNDTVLDDHLNGNLHRERYASAKATLLGPNPFPFSDGVLFFHGLSEQDNQLAVVNSNQDRNLSVDNCNNKLIAASDGLRILDRQEGNVHVGSEVIVHKKNSDSRVCVLGGDGKSLNDGGKSDYVLVPGVVRNKEITDLEIKLIGFGEIATRMCETDETPGSRIISMWCAWLGGENPRSNGYGDVVPEYDFGIVTFSYKYSLGRIDLLEGLGPRLTSSPYSESENVEGTMKKTKKSFSDHEDDYLSSNSPSSNLVLHQYDDQIRHGKLVSSRSARREMRRQQRLAANRMCDLCQQKILPGKDVSTLLNMKTGRLVCSSRNVNGAFHLFHTSCLIHWILFCEFEIWKNQFTRDLALVSQEPRRVPKRKGRAKKSETQMDVTIDIQEPRRGPKRKGRAKKSENQTDVTIDSQEPRRGPKRKDRAKQNEIQMDDGKSATRNKIFSAFCPECQGTGSNVGDDQLEHPNIFLSEMFNYKINLIDAHRAWMKRPEVLENCSTGLIFSRHSDDPTKEKVSPMKLLHFYRADV